MITFAGSLSFVNNTSIKGGAIALYSTSLHLTPGTNVSFINNTVHETGGAIHIEPDLTRMLKLECFFQVDDCNGAKIHLHFKNNSAENGGDNVYGGSFVYCQLLLRDKFCINISLLDNRISSVSSDPLFVCICDSKDQPLCTNTSFIHMTKSVHPGETFALSVAIVSLEYGLTVGIVHAGFLPLHNGSIAASESVPILDKRHINTINGSATLHHALYLCTLYSLNTSITITPCILQRNTQQI